MYEKIYYQIAGKFISRGEWSHPERTIQNYEIIIMTKGTAYMHVGENEYTLTPGDVLLILPDAPHGGTVPSTEPVEFFWTHFLTDAPEELPPIYFRPENTAQSELFCRQLLHYANTEHYPKEGLDCFVRLLIMELSHQNSIGKTASDKRLSEIKEWIRINADMPIKVSDIAKHFKYNEDYLCRIFRKHHPEGLKAYIDTMKTGKIKNDIVNSDMQLREIALKYGFSDYKYFLKYFKYHAGVTPTEYKELYYNIYTNNR